MITMQRFRRRPQQAPQAKGANPYPEALSVTDALRKLDADEAAEGLAPARVPTFTPHPRPAAPTAPQPVYREPGRTLNRQVPQARQQAIPVLRRVRDALARGTTPVGDYADSVFPWAARRLPQIGERRNVATKARIAPYYPEPGGDYAGLMDAVDRITGTTGPRPVFATAGTDGGEHDDR
jgi:hypothetical protein